MLYQGEMIPRSTLLQQIVSLSTLSVYFTYMKKVRGNDPAGEMIPALSYFLAHQPMRDYCSSPFSSTNIKKNVLKENSLKK